MTLLLSNIRKTNYIGEIGLDGSHRYYESRSLQESILSKVLVECKRLGGKFFLI